MHTIAVEVILQALLGVAQGSYLERLRDSVRELLDRYTETRTMAALFILGPALTLRVTALGELLRRVDEALYAEIACRRHDRHCEGHQDVISLLLQARLGDGAQMSDEDVRDQLMSLIVAGHETTGTALAWALERLLRTPSALHRLREEIAAGQDAYADAVCKETLRLRPVVPVVTRRLQEPTQIGGWLLPAGTTVAPCIDLIHRRPDIYPEPSQFRPERFLEDSSGAATYTWIPFGGGVRRCLGAGFALLEMRTVLTTILAQARFRATRIRGERVRRRAVSWAPDRGAEVILEP
jgi:cytochrome P450